MIRRAFIAIAFVLAATRVASAHAYIVGAQPPMNAASASLGATIAIAFDEPIDILDSDALQVFDARGRRVDRRDAHVDPQDATRLVAGISANPRPGIYTVRWRVISADTHVVHGIYQIGVGVAIDRAAPQTADSPFDPSGSLASAIRSLSLLGTLLATGALALQRFVLQRLQPPSASSQNIARKAVLAGTALVLVALVPALLVQAAAESGKFGSGILPTLLHSRWGTAAIVRFGSALALLLSAALAWRRSAIGGFSIACVLLASFSAAGHAFSLSGSGRLIASAVDFVHLLAASVWIGGVLVLALILLTPRTQASDRPAATSLFALFTPLAIAAVVTIVITGAYAAIVHIPAAADLFITTYGRILVAKIALVAILLVFGYFHLRAGKWTAFKVRFYTIGFEAVTGAAIIALTAVLIGQVPPTHTPLMKGMPEMSSVLVHNVSRR
jgi:copper transport protein